MIKSLTVKNFTLFNKEDLTFGESLNVIVGENGTGKTQMLKMLYALACGCRRANDSTSEYLSLKDVPFNIRTKLESVFRTKAENLISFNAKNDGFSFSFRYIEKERQTAVELLWHPAKMEAKKNW